MLIGLLWSVSQSTVYRHVSGLVPVYWYWHFSFGFCFYRFNFCMSANVRKYIIYTILILIIEHWSNCGDDGFFPLFLLCVLYFYIFRLFCIFFSFFIVFSIFLSLYVFLLLSYFHLFVSYSLIDIFVIKTRITDNIKIKTRNLNQCCSYNISYIIYIIVSFFWDNFWNWFLYFFSSFFSFCLDMLFVNCDISIFKHWLNVTLITVLYDIWYIIIFLGIGGFLWFLYFFWYFFIFFFFFFTVCFALL